MFIASLSFTGNSMPKKSNVYRQGVYYNLAQAHIKKDLIVPLYIVKQLNKPAKKEVTRHNHSVRRKQIYNKFYKDTIKLQ